MPMTMSPMPTPSYDGHDHDDHGHDDHDHRHDYDHHDYYRYYSGSQRSNGRSYHDAWAPAQRVAPVPFVYTAGNRVRNWRPDWGALIASVACELEERRRRSDEHRLVVVASGISSAGGVQPGLAGAVPVHAWTDVRHVVEAGVCK